MNARTTELICELQSLKPLVSEVTSLGEAAVKLVHSDPAVLRCALEALALTAEKLLRVSRDCQYKACDLVRLNDHPLRFKTTAEMMKEARHD